MKSVYIINGSGSYRALFMSLGFTVAQQLDESVSLVCFTGGEDVSPSYYGDAAHKHTFNSLERDELERNIFWVCKNTYKIPMVGICRG